MSFRSFREHPMQPWENGSRPRYRWKQPQVAAEITPPQLQIFLIRASKVVSKLLVRNSFDKAPKMWTESHLPLRPSDDCRDITTSGISQIFMQLRKPIFSATKKLIPFILHLSTPWISPRRLLSIRRIALCLKTFALKVSKINDILRPPQALTEHRNQQLWWMMKTDCRDDLARKVSNKGFFLQSQITSQTEASRPSDWTGCEAKARFLSGS